MKYKKYKIIKDFGKYYIEIPYLWLFWQRIGYWKSHEGWYPYTFKTHDEAFNFAEEHKYGVDYVSMS